MVSEAAAIGDIARELNNELNKLMPSNMFFAATLLELKARSDIMSVWVGGMPASYWLAESGELKGVISAQHMPLGILEDGEFDAAVDVFNVESGDKFYFYKERERQLQTLVDASIVFDLSYVPEPGQQHLKIQIKDGGKGYKGRLSASTGDLPYGRGMGIINSFCEKVSFSDDGKTMRVLYRLTQ